MNTTEIHHADVIQVEPGSLWMVESKSTPHSYWPVSLTHEGAASVMHCPCPAGRRLEGVPLPDRRGCRHLVAVVRFVNDLHRRPSMPVNTSAWVD